ncbi:hypothetical protein DS906_09515 [Ruegeria sp. A3M17]|nr:hypothetical protein DS906_09515 [Ruegeria sp. A3M17]
MEDGIDASLRSLFMLFALFGLPLAFVIAWVFVAPTLRVMMRRQTSYTRAIRWGAAIALSFVVLSIAVGRFRGWRQSLDPTFHSQIGGGDYVRSVDGILTPYGWQVLAQNSALFILMCILVALVIRFIIGPGNADGSLEATP